MEYDIMYIDNVEPDDENTLFPKQTTVSKLETMASVTVTVAVLNRLVVELRKTFIVYYDEWRKFLDGLKIPKSLNEIILTQCRTAEKELEDYMLYVFNTLFFTRERNSLYELFCDLVWHPDCSIDVVKTARNFLKSDKLSPMEKFYVACTYCMRDEIERMWPTLVEIRNQVDEITFDSRALVYYWRCHCTQTLNEVPAPAHESIDEFMIKLRAVNNWPAIEYFFDRLNAEQQVANAVWLIDNHGLRFQKLLLMKLSQTQLLPVLMQKAPEILMNFATCENTDRAYTDTMSTWYGVRDLLTRNKFVPLFNRLIGEETPGVILTEIWNTACNDFKPDFWRYNDNLFIRMLLEWFTKQVYKDKDCLTFLSTVLLDAVSENPKRDIIKTIFFKDFCRKYLTYYLYVLPDVKSLGQLINVCSSNLAESNNVKSAIAKRPYFKKMVKKAMKDCNFEWLLELLNFGYPETDPSSEKRKRNFLRSNMKLINDICLSEYYYMTSLNSLNELLAPLISSYPDIVLNFKSKLLLSDAGVEACAENLKSPYTVATLDEIIADGLPTRLVGKFKRKLAQKLKRK